MTLSVIVPVYNTCTFIDQCILSLQNQTLLPTEIILVDDGSTDGSDKKCDEYMNKYTNVKVVHKKNEGLGFARNSGLNLASGDYVAFLDSDDYLAEDYCYEMMQPCELYNLDICVSDGCNKFNQRGVYEQVRFGNNDRLYSSLEEIRRLIPTLIGSNPGDNDGGSGSACFSIYRRELLTLNNLLFVSERYFMSEDVWFNMDVYAVASKIFFSSYRGYYYRYNENSLSRGYNPNRINAVTKSVELLNEKCVNMNLLNYEGRVSYFYWVNFEKCINQEVRYVKKAEAFTHINKYAKDISCKKYLKRLSKCKNFTGLHAFLCKLLYREKTHTVFILLKLYNAIVHGE